jgi:TBP-interacting protein
MPELREVPEYIREWERVAAHSHITGLGLEGLKAKHVAEGMVGQIEAREAAGLVVRLIKEGKFAGRAVLLAGPPGTGKCVSGDTPVVLANGEVKPINQIYEEWKNKGKTIEKSEKEEIIAVKGLEVVSLNPENLKVEIKPVEYIYKQKVDESLLEIKLCSGRRVKLTKLHPLLTLRKNGLNFCKSCELKVGDYIGVPRKLITRPNTEIEIEPEAKAKSEILLQEIKKRIGQIEYSNFLAQEGFSINSIANFLSLNPETVRNWINSDLPYYSKYMKVKNPFVALNSLAYSRTPPIETPEKVLPELGEFFGYLISECDEYIDQKIRSYTIRFHNTNQKLKKRFGFLIKKIFGLNTKFFKDKKTTGIRISNWNLKEFLEAIGYVTGKKSPEKDIPELIMKADEKVIRIFLRAFADGEGSVGEEETEISTSSEKIANKLSYLLLRLGIVARIRKKKVKGRERKYYRVIISGGDFLKIFKEKVGFSIKSKQQKLVRLCKKKPHSNVDLIPNLQELLKDARMKLGVSKQLFYGSKNGYRYEKEENGRKMKRNTLKKIVEKNKIEGVLKILADSDIFWDEIVEIKEVEEKEVYDLCVKDNHTFIAGFGGIVVHNTAIATGIARELGKDVPFVPLAASEIFSTDIRKTEFLTQTLRKAIGARIHEMRKIYEGEVKEISIEKAQHPYNPYQQIPVGATIKIATKDESKKLTMDQSFAIQLIQQGIETGDVIQIDIDGGRVVKLGPSEEAVKDKKLDLTTTKPVPVPKGKVLKEKEFIYPVTLHALDVASARSGGDIFSLFFGGKESKEIEPEVRKEVDEYIKTLVQEGRCELIPGVVFIDECSMLDIETFAFLNRALEQELSPIIIFATNRGFSTIRGTDIKAAHGMPLDLLDRLLIINTKPYGKEDIKKILEIRAKSEKIKLSEDALEYLTEIGSKTSLRYAIQLLAPAFEVAKEKKSEVIEKEHVTYVEKLFVDVKKSVEYLKEYEKQFLV